MVIGRRFNLLVQSLSSRMSSNQTQVVSKVVESGIKRPASEEDHPKKVQKIQDSIQNNSIQDDSIQNNSIQGDSIQDLGCVFPLHLKSEDNLDVKYHETSYYFDGILRKVYPYYFTFHAFAKLRWYNRTLVDVIASEFRAIPKEKIVERIEKGLTKVNGRIVSSDYIIKNGDSMQSKIHRHEMPVLAQRIRIIHEDDEYLVIDKPPSLPVHPCGRYRFNSVIAILYKEHGYRGLHIIHRLDRPTSGVLMFAKNQEKAKTLSKNSADREVKKEYLCRVEGDFPEEEMTVDQPLFQLCHKVGINIVHPQGKPSQTRFQKVSFNGKSSLVRALPLTGRMHQIRLHLQYLGHPIVNDPLYNTSAFGPMKGRGGDYGGMSREELVENLRKEHCVSDWVIEPGENVLKDSENVLKESEKHQEDVSTFLGNMDILTGPPFDPAKQVTDQTCEECNLSYTSPPPRSLMIFLHALKYQTDGKTFQTDLPFWARPDFDLI